MKGKCLTCQYHSKKCDQIARSRMTPTKPEHDTLCWCCVHAVPDNDRHGCTWSERKEPVSGWEAEYMPIGLGGRKSFPSYHVKSCPLFERG